LGPFVIPKVRCTSVLNAFLKMGWGFEDNKLSTCFELHSTVLQPVLNIASSLSNKECFSCWHAADWPVFCCIAWLTVFIFSSENQNMLNISTALSRKHRQLKTLLTVIMKASLILTLC